MQFTPLKDFVSPELNSQYCVGLSYTLRARAPDPRVPGDKGTPAAETPLGKLLPKWLKEGKVRLGAPDVPQPGKVAGAGYVITAADVGKITLKDLGG